MSPLISPTEVTFNQKDSCLYDSEIVFLKPVNLKKQLVGGGLSYTLPAIPWFLCSQYSLVLLKN